MNESESFSLTIIFLMAK